MECLVYIPHANTDHKNFIYRGNINITNKMYMDMERKEHEQFEEPIDVVMDPASGIFGNNIAINPYWNDRNKRHLGIKAQKIQYACCRCRLLNRQGKEFSMDDLKELVEKRNKFIMIVQLKQKDLDFEPDLTIEIRSWLEESMKLLNSPKFTDEEKVLHLPMKTLGIEVRENENSEVLQLLFRDCKIVERKSAGLTTIAMLVKRVDEYIDPDNRKKK